MAGRLEQHGWHGGTFTIVLPYYGNTSSMVLVQSCRIIGILEHCLIKILSFLLLYDGHFFMGTFFYVSFLYLTN